MGILNWIMALFGKPAVQALAQAAIQVAAEKVAKTGVQTGALSDPMGKRVYHEYFVGEDRGDGHYTWLCRVYSGGTLKEVKEGLAASESVARKQADAYGLAIKQRILGAP